MAQAGKCGDNGQNSTYRLMNTSYNIASPANAQPAMPGGAAALQNSLNNLQNAFTTYNPLTKQFAPTSGGFVPSTVYNPSGNSYSATTAGNPSWNGSSWVSSTTGQPYSGTYFGNTYVNGQSYQQLANSPSSYTSLTIPKSPAIAGATSGLLGQFGNNLSLQNNNFSDFLSAANNATNAATTGFNNDINNAYNLQPLGNTLNTLNTNYAGNAGALNNSFNNEANTLNTDYSNTVSNLGNQENAAVSQAYGMLPAYNQAEQNIGTLEGNNLNSMISKYAAASGTPTGLGSNEEQTLAKGLADINVPLQEAQIGQNYNILENLQVPLEQQQAQAQIGQLQNFSMPLAQTQYNQGMNTLNTEYGQQYGTASQLQNLAIQIAGKPISEAVQYMQAMGVPAQVQQAILSGNVSNLAGLSGLWQGANYQGLQNNLGNNVASPTGAVFSAPSRGFNTNYGSNFSGLGGGTYAGQYPSPNNAMGVPTTAYPSPGVGNGFNSALPYGNNPFLNYNAVSPTSASYLTGGSGVDPGTSNLSPDVLAALNSTVGF